MGAKHALCTAAVLSTLALPVSAIESNGPVIPVESPAFQPRPVGLDKPRVRLEKIASGLDQPLFVASAPNDRALFVVEKTGRIRIVRDGRVESEPFLDLSERVNNLGERGLLGFAFDPNYERTGRIFVAYTDHITLGTVISRFQVSAENRFRVDPASERRLLVVPQHPEHLDHKAGWIGFRPGEHENLYIATGDGGGRNDPENKAQNLLSFSGKILRVKVDGEESYSIPADNPFADHKDALPEIWAYGLRNPFRASFDRDTGDLFIGDVGQDEREEINFEPSHSPGGRNYGWRLREGGAITAALTAPDDDFEITDPILEYSHQAMLIQRGCVIGGYVYRGRMLPELTGTYFFADFSNARIYSFRREGDSVTDLTDWSDVLDPTGQRVFFSSLSSFGEDADGELYVVDLAGALYRLAPDEVAG